MSTKSIQITIRSRLEDVPLIGAAMRGLCHEAELRPDDCQGVELCVTEAVVNSIEHAYGRDPAHEVAVTIQDDGARLVIAVRDTGNPMATDMLQRKRQEAYTFDPADIARVPTSGRGLAIIQSYMDRVDYRIEDDGNHLVMVKQKHRAKE